MEAVSVRTPTFILVSSDNSDEQLRDKAAAASEFLGEPVYAVTIDDAEALARAVAEVPRG